MLRNVWSPNVKKKLPSELSLKNKWVLPLKIKILSIW